MIQIDEITALVSPDTGESRGYMVLMSAGPFETFREAAAFASGMEGSTGKVVPLSLVPSEESA